MTVDGGDLAATRARLAILRRDLGRRLALYRAAAGVSQPELGRALGRRRSTISKVENGTRGMPAALWTITDDVCRAGGALIAEHSELARTEQDYRGRCRARHRQQRQAAAQAEIERVRTSPMSLSPVAGHDGWPGMELMSDELAEELVAVVTKLVRSLGRRDAMRVAGWTLAAVGLSAGLDADEYTRVARAVDAPHRVDAQVIQNLAATLAQCKRLEDKLGPCEILDTVVAQHGLVRHLLTECPDRWVKPLRLVESNIASTIGNYLLNMCHPKAAMGYLGRARKAGHDAGNPASAAYAAAFASRVAFLRGDTPTALDMAAAARSLAARTSDARLKALAEQMAAAAYALDGQYGPCLAACARAQEFLAGANGPTPDSPAYWLHEGSLDSLRSRFLCLLGKPRDAVEAARTAHDRYNRSYVGGYAVCQIRLGHALVLDKDTTEAARVLGDAASHANLYPLYTQELHAIRALLQPWQHTQPVKTLDTQLEACGLLPSKHPTPRTGIHRDQRG
ncbi:MAG: helix-turn-helix domain-containing protein [Pseudonocardiaceae bacterium]